MATKKIIMYSMHQLKGKHPTGGMKRFYELYQGLSDKGIEVDLYSPEGEEEKPLGNSKIIYLTALKKRRRGSAPGISFAISNSAHIKNIKKERDVPVIVFDVPTAIGLVLFRVKRLNLFIRQDLVETRRYISESGYKNKFVWFIKYLAILLAEGWCLAAAEKIIVQCDADADALKKRHKFLCRIISKKMYTQVNNVNASWMSSQQRKAPADLNFEKEKYRIGFVGNLGDARKGLLELLKAVVLYGEKYGEIVLYVIGGGNRLEHYQREYSDEKIIFLGYQEKPMDTLINCDLIVIPSLTDSCPNTVLESFYYDIPVIGSDRGGIPELIRTPEAIFKPDAQDILRHLRFFSDKEKRDELMICQEKRKQQLTFDWAEAISRIIFDGE